MEDLTGKQLGHYQIVAPLGEGGMAAVYQAYHPAMDRYVALKILPRHFASDPLFVARFQQEAKVIAKLQHPHILPVHDFGEADGYTYLVMPFIQSGTLAGLIIGEPLPWPRIQTVISQLGDALDYAHAHGLVHRDVKPSNVLIDDSGHCQLTDFGLAKIMEGSIHLTTSGAIMGTPAYMSPEQGMGQKLDGRTDVYSLGVILYEMATGHTPYTAETPMAVMIKHISDPLPLPSTVNPEIPEAVERVILKALTKDREDRFVTAGDMVLALQAALSGASDSEAETVPAARSFPASPIVPPSGVLLPPPTAPPPSQPDVPPPPASTPQPMPLAKPLVFLGLAIIAAAAIVTMPTLLGLFFPPTQPGQPPASTSQAPLAAVTTPIPAAPSPTPLPSVTATWTEIPASPTPAPSPTPAALTGRIAFVSDRDQDVEIYIMNADGSGQTRLTYSQYADNEPMLSPDGRFIVFVSQRAGGHKLFIMNADGADQRQLTDGRAEQEYDPYFSPDGQWIVYSSSRGGRYELWLIHPDGTGLKQLTSGPGGKNFPAWSPDGQWIAYNSVQGEEDVVKVIRSDGTDDRVILQQEDAYLTGWSGGRILFVAPNGATADVYSMNPDGSDVRQLTTDPANDKGAYSTWDGRFIIFNSARDGNDEIYVMRPDGSQQTRITFTPGNDYMPTWGP